MEIRIDEENKNLPKFENGQRIRITPLDENGNPDYSKSRTTEYNPIDSEQIEFGIPLKIDIGGIMEMFGDKFDVREKAHRFSAEMVLMIYETIIHLYTISEKYGIDGHELVKKFSEMFYNAQKEMENDFHGIELDEKSNMDLLEGIASSIQEVIEKMESKNEESEEN